jgi:hypothetical protein
MYAQTQHIDSELEVEQSRIQFFEQNPFDINQISPSELRGLQLLSEHQISTFIAYRSSNGPFISVHELQIITGWDLKTLQKIARIVTCIAPQKKWFQADQSTHQLLLKTERTLEQKVGFSPPTARSKIRYAGNPWMQNIRYRSKWNAYLRGGFLVQKDAGEAKFTDFTSYYLEIKSKKWLDKLIIGDFIHQWGQGLVQSGGFSLGKSYESIRGTQKFDLGNLPYSSSGESNFYRGISTQSHFGALYFSVFRSFRKLDASISRDSLQNEYYRSIDVDGMHRTPTELKNKQSLREHAWGVQARLPWQKGYISFSATEHHWNIPKKNTQKYNQTDWQGSHVSNYSLAHQLPWRHALIAGEFAFSSPKAIAVIESIAFPISQKLDFSGLLRYYGSGYFSPMAQALGEGSQTKNELGIFLGNQYQRTKYQRLSSYIDFFYFQKRNFSYDFDGAWGVEMLSRFQWDRKQKGQYFAQIKWTTKSISARTRKNHLQSSLDIHRKLARHMEWHSRLMLSYIVSPVQNELGAMWLHDLYLTSKRWKIQTRFALIHTPSYDTRLYAYEPTLPYSFSLPAYYDASLRNTLLLSYKPSRHWEIGMKLARTSYLDKETVGSGLDLISNSYKTDVIAQAVYTY